MLDESFVERLVAYAMEDEILRAGQGEILDYEALAETKAWMRLRDAFKDFRQNAAGEIGSVLLSGREMPEKEIARYLGFAEGVEFILRLPEVREAQFESRLKAAYRSAIQAVSNDTATTEQEA
jgi:hypothetical protein